MFPLFFSVSSSDIKFAEKVWDRFPDDWVYLYSKTGEEGVDMWEEISRRELPQSKLFVVFWSKAYTTAQGCIREVLQAKDLVQQGLLRAVFLRLDDHPITWTEDLGETVKPVFEALRPMLHYRTSAPNVPFQSAIDLLERLAEPILQPDHPRLPRHALLKTMREVVKKDRFNCYPAVWVSGFNGVGRESLVRDFNRSFVPNGRGFVVEVNEASLPKQIRLRIESVALGADQTTLSKLNAETIEDEAKAVAASIEKVFTAGNYLILRHSRIVEETVELPEWLNDTVNALKPSTRAKLFVISQVPLLSDRRNQCRELLVAHRVPTLDEHELTDFCAELIGFFDENPGRWDDDEIEKIVQACGGNVGFLVSLVRSASRIEDFDQIDQLVELDDRTMAASITQYVRWAFAQLRGFEDEQRTLLFMNDVTPCDLIDIERAVSPSRPVLRVLGKLLEFGLVEREAENLYRLTPLLAHRLSRDLVRPDLLHWLRDALVAFIKQPTVMDVDGHGYVRIETRIQASILAEDVEVPDAIKQFVSAAHWFQAGIRLYHARRREPAYRILKKAYAKRSEFSTASRAELARYFCLSATRNRKYKEAENCIKLLDGAFQTKGMAAFLRADLMEQQRRFMEAIREYARSLELNKGKDTRLERTYRPLVRCILSSPKPDYALAERYALNWLHLRETVFSKMALARVYLHWKHRGVEHQRDMPDDIGKLYQDALSELEVHPGVGSAHFEIKAEEARFSGDFSGAVTYMDRAIEADPRFELRATRWRLMASTGDQGLSEQVISELNDAKHNSEYRGNWLPFLPALTETYAIALTSASRPLGLLNTFAAELTSDEIGTIVARSKRVDGLHGGS